MFSALCSSDRCNYSHCLSMGLHYQHHHPKHGDRCQLHRAGNNFFNRVLHRLCNRQGTKETKTKNNVSFVYSDRRNNWSHCLSVGQYCRKHGGYCQPYIAGGNVFPCILCRIYERHGKKETGKVISNPKKHKTFPSSGRFFIANQAFLC